MDPISQALYGDVDFFKTVSVDVLLGSTSDMGGSALSVAVMENHLDCCFEIYKRCPSLIYGRSYGDHFTPLHHGAWRGKPDMVKFLIAAGAKADSETQVDIENHGGQGSFTRKALTMADVRRETALHKAANTGSHEAIKLLLDADVGKELLRMLDIRKSTALHWAVQHTQFEAAKCLLEADPSFEYGVNNSGETPLLAAMRGALSHDSSGTSGKIRRLIIQVQPSQSKIRTGDKNWTALHHAAYCGDLSAVEDILRFCPECSELADSEGRNFLHIAAKFEQVKVVKYILGANSVADSVLNERDDNGHTPLHLAALGGSESLTLSLLYDRRVFKMTANAKGQKVLDAINFDYDKRKAGVHGLIDGVDQKDLKEQSDFDLVVGALIATVSFTVGITVPGGFISDGPNKGMAVLSKSIWFDAFVMSNIFAFVFSLYAVLSHFCARRLIKKDDIIYQLNVATFCTVSAIFAMMMTFITGSFAVLSNSRWLAVTVTGTCCWFFIFALRAIWTLVMQRRHATLHLEC